MAAELSPPNRDRLVKLLGLLGSDHVGERAAAGAKASELVKRCGATWSDLIGAGPTPRAQQHQRPRPAYEPPPAPWQADLTFCRRHIGHLSNKDGEFVLSLRTGRKVPTVRQQAWLTDICGRLRRGGFV